MQLNLRLQSSPAESPTSSRRRPRGLGASASSPLNIIARVPPSVLVKQLNRLLVFFAIPSMALRTTPAHAVQPDSTGMSSSHFVTRIVGFFVRTTDLVTLFVVRNCIEVFRDELLPTRESVAVTHWEIMAECSKKKLLVSHIVNDSSCRDWKTHCPRQHTANWFSGRTNNRDVVTEDRVHLLTRLLTA
jgi:hypothetical protein